MQAPRDTGRETAQEEGSALRRTRLAGRRRLASFSCRGPGPGCSRDPGAQHLHPTPQPRTAHHLEGASQKPRVQERMRNVTQRRGPRSTRTAEEPPSPFSWVTTATFKQTKGNQRWRGRTGREHSLTAGGMETHTILETSVEVPQKAKNRTSTRPAISLPGVHPEEMSQYTEEIPARRPPSTAKV